METQTKEPVAETLPREAPPAQLPAAPPHRPERVYMRVEDKIPLLDTARFEHMQRIATIMAKSSLVPEHLVAERVEENGRKVWRPLPEGVAIANCFLVVNQAVRWQMDPFGVAQGVFVHKGKLGYEGKLVAAVINSHPAMAERLRYYFEGEGAGRKVVVVGRLEGEEEYRSVEGTLADWRTDNEMWKKASVDQPLSYRGAREWARRHLPEAMLGVLADDELADIGEPKPMPAALPAPKTAKDALDRFAGAQEGGKALPAAEATAGAGKAAGAAAVNAGEAVKAGVNPTVKVEAKPKAAGEAKEAPKAEAAAETTGEAGKASGGEAVSDSGAEIALPKPDPTHVSMAAKGKWLPLWQWLRLEIVKHPQAVREAMAKEWGHVLRAGAAKSASYRADAVAFLSEAGLDAEAILAAPDASGK